MEQPLQRSECKCKTQMWFSHNTLLINIGYYQRQLIFCQLYRTFLSNNYVSVIHMLFILIPLVMKLTLLILISGIIYKLVIIIQILAIITCSLWIKHLLNINSS